MTPYIYTSVSNADVIPCKKGQLIKSDPIPLLRDKYLGEYRTELEKAKVRKNLGIPDENNLRWGNIEGFVEEQKDLVTYVESKWLYQNEISEDITNIKEALDYVIYFINNYKTNDESVKELNIKFTELDNNLKSLETNVQNNYSSITELLSEINIINENIQKINSDLQNINVDQNILNWVQQKLENSKSINLQNDILDLKISQKENNAVFLEEDGIFVKDYSNEINKISQLQETIDLSTKYTTNLSDNSEVPTKVGGIDIGTTVSQLKNKSLIEILDIMLFPTTVRELIYPKVQYSYINNLVKVGDTVQKPILTFIQNDAGPENNRIETISFNNQIYSKETYEEIGTYYYKGVVYYDSGEYLIDNKGQITNKRIESGQIEANTNVTATYPWYAGNSDYLSEQILVKFNQDSGNIDFNLSGKNSCIKLPGDKTIINSFKSDGGMGYLDVDLNGWEETSEIINGITYKVWTKQDDYTSIIPHRINFKLEL